MMFTRRQKTLIMELVRANEYITSRQLALSAGVSIRTVKSEIKNINELLDVYDICIEAKTGYGYRMNTMGNKAIPDINYFLEDMDYENYVRVSDSMEDRIHYIACRLLENEDYIKSEVLADELYISTSTLSHDLKQVKYIFQIYGLKIASKPYKGICVTGKEKNIRNCIDFLCFKGNSGNNDSYYIYGEDVMDRIEELYRALCAIVENYHFQYPSYSLHDIAIQAYIALERMKSGRVLRDEHYVYSSAAASIAKEYALYIEEHYRVLMPLAERCRLECMIDTLYIVEEMETSDQEYKYILNDAFQEIRTMFNFDFQQEYALTTSLLQHIHQLVKRCRNDVLIYNPLAQRVLCDYLLSVDFANVLARKLEEKYRFKISIDEFSYLVLYFNVTIYSSSHMKDKSLYIYCPQSRAQEQMIREEVKRLFKEIVNKIAVVSREELETMHHSGLDIIVTSEELPACVPDYVQHVHADLNHKMEFISQILIQLNEQVEGYFNISEFLSEDMFFTEQSIASKDEYFEFLFDSLCESFVMDYGEAGCLYERVEKFGQEVGHHVVLVRSQNRFVLPFIHVIFVKDMFYWDTDYARAIIFVNFADSDVEFRDFIYKRFKAVFSDKEKMDRIFRTMDFQCFADVLSH